MGKSRAICASVSHCHVNRSWAESCFLPQSYDTGSIGAITTMPYFEESIGVLSPVMRGFTISLLLLTGAVPSFFAGQLSDRYGQLRAILVGTLVFILGAVLQSAASKLSMLLVGRALCGIGEGLWLSNVSMSVELSLFLSSFCSYRNKTADTIARLHLVPKGAW